MNTTDRYGDYFSGTSIANHGFESEKEEIFRAFLQISPETNPWKLGDFLALDMNLSGIFDWIFHEIL